MLTLFSAFFLSTLSFAATIEVIGACSTVPIFSSENAVEKNESLGAFTLRAFNEGGLEFIGAEKGINSIQGSPIGLDAIEIISREEMRAYGWCFKLNGESPMVYANEIFLSSNSDRVEWIFGYAHYLRGEWLSMCEPAWKLAPDFLCKKK